MSYIFPTTLFQLLYIIKEVPFGQLNIGLISALQLLQTTIACILHTTRIFGYPTRKFTNTSLTFLLFSYCSDKISVAKSIWNE